MSRYPHAVALWTNGRTIAFCPPCSRRFGPADVSRGERWDDYQPKRDQRSCQGCGRALRAERPGERSDSVGMRELQP